MRGDLDQLRRAFEDYRHVPFPDDSNDDELSEVHAELAEYDGYIAGLVSTHLGGGRIEPHLLKDKHDLRARLERIVLRSEPAITSQAQEYLHYLSLIERLVQFARIQT